MPDRNVHDTIHFWQHAIKNILLGSSFELVESNSDFTNEIRQLQVIDLAKVNILYKYYQLSL